MNPTKYARDNSGASVSLVHWKWGSRRVFDVGAAPTRSSEPLNGHSVFVEVSTACHIRLGDASVTVGTADPILKPGAVYAFPRAVGETHMSLMVVNAGATGRAEYWEADTFVEA